MFGFGEDEEHEHTPKRSIFSSIGDFLLKAVTVLAIIALAVITAVTISDTARDKLNDLTKDKNTGHGGLGDSIRSSMGLAKEKATGAIATVGNAIGSAFQSGKDTVVSAKNQAVETANTAENIALAGTGALVAKKVYDRTINPNIKGTVNAEGKFEELSRKDRKAVEALQKLEKQQEALKAQREELLKKSAQAREELKKASAAKETAKAESDKFKGLKDKFSKAAVKAGMALKSTSEAEIKAESTLTKLQKELKQLRKDIQSNIKAIATTEKLVPAGVTTRGDYNKSKAAATAGAAAKPETNTKAETTKTGAGAKETIHPPKTELLDANNKPITGKDGKPIVYESKPSLPDTSSSSGFWNKLKGTAGKLKTFGKGALAPAAVAATVIEGGSQAMASFEEGNSKEAAKQLAATATQAGVLAVAPEAYMAGALMPDSLKNAVSGTIEGGRQAFLERKLANLPKEQQDIVAAWAEEAKARDLKISPTEIMGYLEKNGLSSSPVTPQNTLTGSKELK